MPTDPIDDPANATPAEVSTAEQFDDDYPFDQLTIAQEDDTDAEIDVLRDAIEDPADDPTIANCVPPDAFGDPSNVLELNQYQARALAVTAANWATWLTHAYYDDVL